MEAPNCYDCKLIPWGHKCPHEYETLVRDSATVVVPHRNAGPDCPFVKLAKKDAEIEGLWELVAAIASAPFPIHDYVTKEQWEQACNIYAARKEVE